MHFDILVEDLSGKVMLESLLKNMLISTQDTYKINTYKGIGHLPKNLKNKANPATRALLNQLPSLLQGLGKTYLAYGETYEAVVIIIFDLDQKNIDNLQNELGELLESCDPKPNTKFCIAIEEGEAWLLGDTPAISKAYPSAKAVILNSYTNDSICDTWELLADAIYPKGSVELKKIGYPTAGKIKYEWAKKITPLMDIDKNKSPSFNNFYNQIKALRTVDE